MKGFMRYNGQEVHAKARDAVIVKDDSGVLTTITSYNPTLIGYESVKEAQQDKRKEIILPFDADYEALFSVDGEFIEASRDRILFKTAANRTAAENNKIQQANTLITKLETKLTDIRNAGTVADVLVITWN